MVTREPPLTQPNILTGEHQMLIYELKFFSLLIAFVEHAFNIIEP